MEPYSLQRSPGRDTIQAVQHAALAAVEPGAAVRRHFVRQGSRLSVAGREYDLGVIDRIWVVGAGKAAAAMAAAVSRVIGDRITSGLVVAKYGHVPECLDTGRIEVVEAGHPVPDEAGLDATRRMVDLVSGATRRDLVVAVLSGGASALTTLPAPGLALSDLQSVTELLLRSGATIAELNVVRKHLSQVKGGDLVRRLAPAQVVGLILSDVVGDPVEAVASGPTAPDPSRFVDAWSVIESHGLGERLPARVREHLEAGRQGQVPETPKPGDPIFVNVHNVVVGCNRLAAEAAVLEARVQGLNGLLLSTFVEGQASQVGRVAAALARELVAYDRPVPRPACLVWGGETTVTVRGRGKGGRNQELALAAAVAMEGLPGVVLVAFGSDGIDGPTDAAGAIATGDTIARALALGLDPARALRDNDAYPFFRALGDLIVTGPTGTNVNDLLFLFAFLPA